MKASLSLAGLPARLVLVYHDSSDLGYDTNLPLANPWVGLGEESKNANVRHNDNVNLEREGGESVLT
ncbi:Uncharacterized protein TCM_017547 [Theobroma cacao]|uniref:Uncharacterized protein n=1 Tax=Theobroma cacao TaxID=3641 RepID=A0A061EDU9_THECC|nr:Uncharacterized protein TCM_017547 [Theobroma cacao]